MSALPLGQLAGRLGLAAHMALSQPQNRSISTRTHTHTFLRICHDMYYWISGIRWRLQWTPIMFKRVEGKVDNRYDRVFWATLGNWAFECKWRQWLRCRRRRWQRLRDDLMECWVRVWTRTIGEDIPLTRIVTDTRQPVCGICVICRHTHSSHNYNNIFIYMWRWRCRGITEQQPQKASQIRRKKK